MASKADNGRFEDFRAGSGKVFVDAVNRNKRNLRGVRRKVKSGVHQDSVSSAESISLQEPTAMSKLSDF